MAGPRRENLESKIIIRHYPPDTSDKDLRIMFEKYGKIEDRELTVNCFSSDSCVLVKLMPVSL